jgi:anti-anti-sigma regulatory factor
MRIIVPSILNDVTFEKVIKNINSSGNDAVILDLRGIKFIEPYGLVGLVSLIRFLSENGRKIELISPGWIVQSYLNRMELYHAITEYAPLLTPSRTLFSTSLRPLLEITKIDFTNGINNGFMKVGNLLFDRMGSMLSGNTGYSGEVVDKLITSIIEVCQNIEHSQTSGYVAAQKYDRSKNAVKVGIMDLGIGISGSLRPRYSEPGEIMSYSKALDLAIKLNYTGRESGSGGLGLVKIRDFIVNNNGCELSIRSGKAKYSISQQGKEKINGGLEFFPGTQVSMTIRPKC